MAPSYSSLKFAASPVVEMSGSSFCFSSSPSLVTQFVAGGSYESDLELLHTSDWLVKHLRLTRAYFSAFNPIRDTPLENKPATDPLREHRLYQASFLLRDYGFCLEELPFKKNGQLPLPADPKEIWARENLLHQPIEINKANRNQLLRIPGIGQKGADSILQARRLTTLNDLALLKKLGISSPNKAAPFLLLNGRRPTFQLPLILKWT